MNLLEAYGATGSNGGSVILKVDEGIRTLMDFRYKSIIAVKTVKMVRLRNRQEETGRM